MKTSVLFTALTLVTIPNLAAAHCQVPCGIYDDHARIHAMHEDITTIKKSIEHITQLAAKDDAQSVNQRIRWVNTKEAHAEKIIRSVSDYFLVQKIKSSDRKYVDMLKTHHAVMKAAMKCKQSVSADALNSLQAAVDRIAKFWPKK